MVRRIHAPPRAGAMIEALRGLGYNTSTALADIIDNSIAAGSSRILVDFHWAGASSRVLVLDDGRGMSSSELELAMRLGERDPLEKRRQDDLGRFGLGLKTASFSQGRRLTVMSRRDSVASCLRWDLDEIAASGGSEWALLEGPARGSEHLPDLLPDDHGTLVAWEVLDRLVTPGFGEQDMLDLIDRVEAHLSMVFHRYIEDPDRLRIVINSREIRPWDPFLEDHRDTWSSPEERITTSSGAVVVRSHVLPHRDRLAPAEYEATAGPDGWTAQQGFYVYRQDRLLLGGSWLGLGRGRRWTREETHRLARIRIDLGNSADHEWKIDVRKSIARPPVEVRTRLLALAQDTRARAARVFAWRGRPMSPRTGQPVVVQAWISRSVSGGIRYTIDEKHPAVAAVLDQAGPLAPEIRAMLGVIAETVPVQRIWLDTAENRETPRTGFSAAPPSELLKVLEVIYRDLVERRGLSPDDARKRLLLTEPFDSHPAVVAALPDIPAAGNRS